MQVSLHQGWKTCLQEWKVKLIFRGAWNSLMAWLDWPLMFYDRSTSLVSAKDQHYNSWLKRMYVGQPGSNSAGAVRAGKVGHTAVTYDRLTWPTTGFGAADVGFDDATSCNSCHLCSFSTGRLVQYQIRCCRFESWPQLLHTNLPRPAQPSIPLRSAAYVQK